MSHLVMKQEPGGDLQYQSLSGCKLHLHHKDLHQHPVAAKIIHSCSFEQYVKERQTNFVFFLRSKRMI